MISIRSSRDMQHALALPLDPELKRLLALRRDQLLAYEGYDLGELAHFVIVEPGDSLDATEEEAGVPFATNLIDGTRHGSRGFTSSFEFVQRHPEGWFEAVLILSDDGFGLSLWVPDRPDINPTLIDILRNHA